MPLSLTWTCTARCRCFRPTLAGSGELQQAVAYWLIVLTIMTGPALGTIGLMPGMGALVHRKSTPRPAA